MSISGNPSLARRTTPSVNHIDLKSPHPYAIAHPLSPLIDAGTGPRSRHVDSLTQRRKPLSTGVRSNSKSAVVAPEAPYPPIVRGVDVGNERRARYIYRDVRRFAPGAVDDRTARSASRNSGSGDRPRFLRRTSDDRVGWVAICQELVETIGFANRLHDPFGAIARISPPLSPKVLQSRAARTRAKSLSISSEKPSRLALEASTGVRSNCGADADRLRRASYLAGPGADGAGTDQFDLDDRWPMPREV